LDKLSAAVKDPPSIWQQSVGPRVAYLKCLTAAIMHHAQEGNLVYHGYAGHLLLNGVPQVLRIRVIAGLEFRIELAKKMMNLDRNEAIEYIERVDKERSRWTYFLYGLEWEDPVLYDWVLNLEYISIENACNLVAYRIKQDDFTPNPESQKIFADALLSSRVWASLARDERTRVASIQVSSDSGVVTITGSLGSQKIIDTILQVVGQVKGVRSIINHMGIGTDWYW
jgi:osmotically-inducible protein OsmY